LKLKLLHITSSPLLLPHRLLPVEKMCNYYDGANNRVFDHSGVASNLEIVFFFLNEISRISLLIAVAERHEQYKY